MVGKVALPGQHLYKRQMYYISRYRQVKDAESSTHTANEKGTKLTITEMWTTKDRNQMRGR